MAMYLYTVHGSEDGIIAVATSPKRAVEIARQYVEQIEGVRAKVNSSYDLRAAVYELSRKADHGRQWFVQIDGDDDSSTHAEIEKFAANAY